jgi:hypothetical protein
MSTFYILANIVSIFCSKNAAEDKDPFMKYEELLSSTALMVRQAPEGEEREKVIALAGTGLAAMHQEVHGINGQDISSHIRTLSQDFEHNPFVAKISPHQDKAAPVAANSVVNLTIRTPPTTAIETAGGINNHPMMAQPSPSVALH